MAYDSSAFAGLTPETGIQNFFFGGLEIELAEANNGLETGPREGTYVYDDTCFGEIPGGALQALSTYAGELAQLMWANPFSGVTDFTLHSLTFSMTGFGDLDCVDDTASNTADATVLIASEMPLTSLSGWGFDQNLKLLRPTPIDLLWTGRDDSNQALRTLWIPSEIGPVTMTADVSFSDATLGLNWIAKGWNGS